MEFKIQCGTCGVNITASPPEMSTEIDEERVEENIKREANNEEYVKLREEIDKEIAEIVKIDMLQKTVVTKFTKKRFLRKDYRHSKREFWYEMWLRKPQNRHHHREEYQEAIDRYLRGSGNRKDHHFNGFLEHFKSQYVNFIIKKEKFEKMHYYSCVLPITYWKCPFCYERNFIDENPTHTGTAWMYE